MGRSAGGFRKEEELMKNEEFFCKREQSQARLSYAEPMELREKSQACLSYSESRQRKTKSMQLKNRRSQ